MSIMQLPKKGKVPFYFKLPEDFEKQWRKYVGDKYGGFHRGVYSKEVEAALRHYMESEKQ
jgi:hypothetical protein